MSSRVRHDDFLRRLSTGDLNPGSDEARRHFGECQSCRERWRELARLIEELDGADLERREVLAQAGDPSPRDVERSLAAAVGAGIAAPPGAERARSASRGLRRIVLLSLAAAALLCAAIFVVRAWTADRRPSDQGPMLGPGGYSIEDADDVLDASGVTIVYPAGAWPRFRVVLEGRNSANAPVTRSQEIDTREFRPEPALLESFAGEVVLRVLPLTPSGEDLGISFERKFSLSH